MSTQPDSIPDPEQDPAPRWDANDPRRQTDCFAPPTEPCECYCLHCGRTFMSDQIWFQKIIGDPGGLEGFWMCPTPNCSGAGFTFDIFPTDPAHPANADWEWCDDDDEYDEDEPEPEYDPDEPAYRQIDDELPDDDDIEGEEWKLGLQPGEQPPAQSPEPDWIAEQQRQHEEELKKYDAPDERPRELDWSNRTDRDQPFDADDIPF